jgi:superfamily II DNA/RNA helicase
MLQSERIDKIQSFKRGKFTFLVCTDIAARGIDVENITHIINYDIPVERENYIHRIGRTGRFTNNGTAITFVTPKEYPYLKKIEEHFHITINEGKIPSLKRGKNYFMKNSNLLLTLKRINHQN